MAKSKSENGLNWLPLNVDGFSKEESLLYAAMVKARTTFAEAKEKFEATFEANARKAKKIEAHEELVFTYKYGPAAAKKTADDKKKPSGNFF